MSGLSPTAEAHAPPTVGRSTEAQAVRRRLRAAWRADQAAAHARGLGEVALAIAAALWAMLLVDWGLALSPAGRMVMAGLAALMVLALAWRRWLRRLERFDRLAWALRLERAEPRWRSLLVSAVQLDQPAPEASPALIAAVQQQAAEALSALRIGHAVDRSAWRRPLATWTLALLLLTLGGVGFGDYFNALGRRLISPAAGPYPALTRIISISGDRLVRRGEPLTLEAVGRGLTPGAAELRLRTGDEAWESIALRRGPGRRYAHRFAQVVRGFEYRFVIGDAVSKTYRVEVAAAPRVVSTEVDLAYPDYMDREEESTDELSLTVPRGTTVRWTLRFDRPLREAALLRIVRPRGEEAEGSGGDGERVETRPLTETTIGEDRMAVTARWRAAASVRYALRVVDARHGMTHPRTLMHRIDVIDDVPPSVQWLGATPRLGVATPNKRLDLRFRASDDHGVRSAAIVYSVNGGAEQRRAIGAYGGDRVVEDRARAAVRELDARIEPGDVIAFAVEARDVRPEGREPGVGRSERMRLRIVTEAAYQTRMDGRLDEVLSELSAARSAGASVRDAMRPLRPFDEQKPGASGATDAAREAALAEAQQSAASLQRRLGRLSGQLRAMAGDLRANRLYQEAGGRRLDRMARQVDRAAAGRLREAIEAMRGARDKPGEAAARLTRAEEQRAAAMRAIDGLLQGSGRQHVRARLAAEARRLTEAQWRLRERLSGWARGVITGDPPAESGVERVVDQQRALREAMAALGERLEEAAGQLADRSLERAAQEAQFEPPADWAAQAAQAAEAGRPIAAAEAADRAMRATAALAAMLWEGSAGAGGLTVDEAANRLKALGREQRSLFARIERVGADAPQAARQRWREAQRGLARVCETLRAELAEATHQAAADRLHEALEAMRDAEAALADRDGEAARRAHRAATEAIERAAAALDGEVDAQADGAGDDNGGAAGETTERAPWLDGANGGEAAGPGWERATWRTLYSQYLDDLPAEYRTLLEDYYEVLSE